MRFIWREWVLLGLVVSAAGCSTSSTAAIDPSGPSVSAPADSSDEPPVPDEVVPASDPPTDPPYEDPTFVPTTIDLPIVTITTTGAAPIVSTEDYVNGHLTIATPEGAVDVDSDLQIRGRGHSTWALPKKPYKLKLPSKTSVLGMPADKEWCLLADYSDKTLMRTTIAFELGRQLGTTWTPRTAYVEVFLNGRYDGVYQLTETIKTATNRVNIASLDEDDVTEPEISGGYLIEESVDGVVFGTPRQVPFEVHDPDPPVPEQLAYVTDYVTRTESSIYSDGFADPENGYASLLDASSFADWYLVNELFANNDSIFLGSAWMYKDRGEKLTMGPVWDFDLGAGNVNYTEAWKPEGFWAKNGPWFERLTLDPAFEAIVKAKWRALKGPVLDTLPSFIDTTATFLAHAENNNYRRWLTIDKAVWPNHVVMGSYDGEVAYLKDWLSQRIAWLDAQYQ